MVIACLALAVALSGTGYAAIRLPAKSVGAKQLKNGAVTNKKLARGAVTASKVARNSLTGAQIKSSTLGTVRNAAHASSADTATIATTAATATNVAAPEGFHNVGATGEPTFQHSWQNNPTATSGYAAGFYKDRQGVVHLRGRIVGGSGNNSIFQLPPGYRPATGKSVAVAAACECTTAQTTIITILGSGFDPTAEGGVTMSNGTLVTSGSLWLDGISFRAES